MPKKYKLIFIIVIIFAMLLPIFSVQAAGIVPCGRSADDPSTPETNESIPCTLCHFIVGIKNIIDFGSKILVITAIMAIFIAGIMYIISSGSQEMMTRAKSFLSSSLIGFFIVIAGWFIVNSIYWMLSANISVIGKTNWYTFTCVTQSTTGTAPVPPITTQTYPENILTDAEARKKLNDAGIQVNKANCTAPSQTNCTSLDGIPASTIENIISTKNICGVTPTVTGGTEAGHQSHGKGKSIVDFRWNASLASCLKSKASTLNVVKICTMAQDSQYRINCNYNEPNQHIHIEYKP